MRILQVVPYFSWESGGPVRVVYDLARELAKRNHEVVIYTTDVGPLHRLNESEKIRLDSRVKIHYFRCVNNWIAQKWRLQLSGQMVSAFNTSVKDFDIVHTHETRGFHNVCVWHYARKYGIPYVLQAHGALPKRLEQQGMSFVLSKYVFDAAFGYRTIQGASKVIALTDSEVQQYKQIGVKPGNIEVVPNGIDLSDFEDLPARGKWRKRYGIDDDQRIILFVGRLHRTKGIDLLLKAFKEASGVIDDLKLVIMGPDDGFRANLENLVQELQLSGRILFTGFVAQDEKIEALVDADLFVTPQFYGFPVTFLEACACGTPILTTNHGGELDWIDNKLGLVVDYDKDSISEAIVSILERDSLRQAFGREAQRLVRDRFSLEKVTDRIEMLYKECVA
ncbi:MAG: glycosyltransferase [Halobacteriota archaeon]|jgi:glycosyltransferase involved in cell wall biosynthesis